VRHRICDDSRGRPEARDGRAKGRIFGGAEALAVAMKTSLVKCLSVKVKVKVKAK
jgi:hypothetical protein